MNSFWLGGNTQASDVRAQRHFLLKNLMDSFILKLAYCDLDLFNTYSKIVKTSQFLILKFIFTYLNSSSWEYFFKLELMNCSQHFLKRATLSYILSDKKKYTRIIREDCSLCTYCLIYYITIHKMFPSSEQGETLLSTR